MSLLIRGGHVLDRELRGLERADVLVDRDRIVAVGPNLSAPNASVLDVTDRLLVPGLVNAHTHAHNHLLKGTGDNWTLEDIHIYRTPLYANRTADDQYLSAAIGAVEMLRTGCTSAFDLFTTSPATTDEAVEAVVRAYIDVGLRAVLAPSVSDIPFHRAVPGLIDGLPARLREDLVSTRLASAKQITETNEAAIRRWNGAASGRISFAVAPTIPGQCSDELILESARLSREYDVPFHTHLVETKVQAVNAVQRWGTTMVSALANMGVLTPRFVGGHGVWLTEEDIAQLGGTGASVVHNPASNLKLGSGIAPIRELLDHGVNVALGTDGSMTSDNQNMFEAMRFAALLDKVRAPHRPDRWLGARAVWDIAMGGGAQALGLRDDIGAIAVGRLADIVVLRLDSPFLRPLNSAVNALVYAETAADVETVVVAGQILLQEGRVLTVDESALRMRAQEAADRIRSQNVKAWATADELRPYLDRACGVVVQSPFPVNRYAVPIAQG